MAHKEKMYNVRIPGPLVDRARAFQDVDVKRVGLDASEGTYQYPYRGRGFSAPFKSITKVLAAAIRLGLAELGKRVAAAEKEAEAKRHQIALPGTVKVPK